ncbi:MAG TPA: SDR family NAD(P)-dependent oxidoreductase [Acidimicrobiales bacterium]|nr:SDR family NAD(P)-dependent oxidoreductase [Acidimicrobiales bacterium]
MAGRRDLTGKVAVVTGASSGIGEETARALEEECGATVVRATRDTGLDLADLDTVVTYADGVLAAHDRIDLLVNNAGVMATPFGRTKNGFETQFGTNHLGHFLLTVRLLPAIRRAAPGARIVNVSSAGHRASDIDWDDPNYEHRAYDKWEAYGQSKTANILFAVELERRLGADGIHAYAVHPGMIATRLGRHLDRSDYETLKERARRSPAGGLPGYKSLAEGAATTIYAATSPDLAGTGGVYLADEAISDEHAPWALDRDNARRLWELSERLLAAWLTPRA